MKPFHTVAVPHKDILEGRLTENVFAADLWEVFKGRGPDDYRDPELFFAKTFETSGLRRLVTSVHSRLTGAGGNPVIQLQTPFGGGKTHSLIYLYHKARRDWNANVVVIVGDKMSSGDKIEEFETLWSAIERQLTGSVTTLDMNNAPDGEKLRAVLEKHQPLLILIDEIIPYLNRAAAVKVGDTSLATLTMNFIQTLTETVGTLERVALVMTSTPSNPYERTPEGEARVQSLKAILERVEAIETPVNPEEVSEVIRKRLFSKIDLQEAKNTIINFVEYAKREGILPDNMEPTEYKERFVKTYPFMPEVIDVLYERWGTFPEFQRTRGVLKFLSMVIYDLRDSELPYISLADIPLENEKIRAHLINVIGDEYNGILDADITCQNSNAKIVDGEIRGYEGVRFGTRVATTIFMYSFSGGVDKSRGATATEIKRSASKVEHYSSLVDSAIQKLRERMFYLQEQDGRYFISNKPNINRIILTKMDNIDDNTITEFEKRLLSNSIGSGHFSVYIWPSNSADIPDDSTLKLVILQRADQNVMDDILNNKGKTPRVNKNTIIFLTPNEDRRGSFEHLAKSLLAYRDFLRDPSYELERDEKEALKRKEKELTDDLNYEIKKLYSMVYLPSTGGKLEPMSLGMPPMDKSKLDSWVYTILLSEQEINTSFTPKYIKDKFLRDGYVKTANVLRALLGTPGELRIVSVDVLKRAIKEGVQTGAFGLGELKDERPVCVHYRKRVSEIYFSDEEIIVESSFCSERPLTAPPKEPPVSTGTGKIGDVESGENEGRTVVTEQEDGGKSRVRRSVNFEIAVPRGKVADLMKIISYLRGNFDKVVIRVEATEGEIRDEDYENKVEEALKQLKESSD